jgi:hypothetical protein
MTTQTEQQLTDTVEVSPETITKALQEIGLIEVPTDWVLLSPTGEMWRGNPEQLLQVLFGKTDFTTIKGY